MSKKQYDIYSEKYTLYIDYSKIEVQSLVSHAHYVMKGTEENINRQRIHMNVTTRENSYIYSKTFGTPPTLYQHNKKQQEI